MMGIQAMPEFPDNPVLQEDVEELADWAGEQYGEALSGARILITGATGLIGSQVAGTLSALNRKQGTQLQVLLPVRNAARAAEGRLKGIAGRTETTLWDEDVCAPLSADTVKTAEELRPDYIIHCAAPTRSRDFVARAADTALAVIDGTRRMLDLARTCQIRSMIQLSSLEVYGTPRRDAAGSEDVPLLTEVDFGTLDPAKPRSSYSEGKRMAETLCSAYAAQHQLPVRILRLTQTFGPGVDYADERAFMAFARSAMEGQDIVLRTAGRTVRPYLYTADAVRAILTLLMADGEAFPAGTAANAANPKTAVTIVEMAETAAHVIGSSRGHVPAVRIEIPDTAALAACGFNPEMQLNLDISRITALGWMPTRDLAEMFARLADGVIR